MSDTALSARPQISEPRRLAGVLLCGLLALSGCTTVLVRNAVPEDQLDAAAPYGIDVPFLRTWGDEVGEPGIDFMVRTRVELMREVYADQIASGKAIERDAIAFSGGGPDGAFGAGMMAGWTARGDRPDFTLVTGVSTGAIIALFTFLGPEYDDALKEIYTSYETSDLVVPAIFAGLTAGTALLDASGYRRLIERYITQDIVDKIAEEYRKGRVLLIGTTNLDAARPATWNLGAIAASGHPQARRLIHDVIQASSAIPAAFPPAIIPVTGGDGRTYDEMHVDGGATQQVILFSPQLPIGALDEQIGTEINRRVYVVMNNKLQKPYDPVRPRVYAIAGSAVSSLISGSGTGDVYKIFAIAERDGLDLNVVAIPTDFDVESESPFDPVYMGALYDLGYEIGLAGEQWSKYPPGFAPITGAAETRTGTGG